MFNHTLLITRRATALVALTIVVAMAARTTSAFALESQTAPIALVFCVHEATVTAPTARRPLSDRRLVRRGRASATPPRSGHDFTLTRTGADPCS